MGVTLLEISLDDAEITANAPFSGAGPSRSSGKSSSRGSTPDEDTTEIEIGEGDVAGESAGTRSGGGPPIKPMLAIAGLFVLALLARRAMSSRGSGADEI